MLLTTYRLWFLAIAWHAVFLSAVRCSPAQEIASPVQLEFFEKQVRPLLVSRCYECHAGLKSSGGLQLDSRDGLRKGGDSGAVLIPGQPDQSLIIAAVSQREGALVMPPKDRGQPLSDSEVAILKQWIEVGAPDPRSGEPKVGGMTFTQARSWWAYQPLSGDLPPETLSTTNRGGTELDHEIDQLVSAKLRAAGIEPLPDADPMTLARRVAYDLTGLPPQAELTGEYLGDPSLVNYRRMIDRTLESPHYGEHWGRHWLDLVRYADTAGENTDRPLPHIWRYRNWVINALNRDMPYDEFVRLQIAGDLVRSSESGERYAEGVIATGYLALARRFGHDIDKDEHLMHEDVIDNLGKCFLGLTVACARCHDHKFDAIEMRDYYALTGIFVSSRFSFPGCEAKGQPRDLVPLWAPSDLAAAEDQWRKKRSAFDDRLQVLESKLSAARGALQERLQGQSVTLLSEAIDDGGAAEFNTGKQGTQHPVKVRRGDMLVLRIGSQGNHGADTTQVAWTIRAEQHPDALWNTEQLIDGLTAANPILDKIDRSLNRTDNDSQSPPTQSASAPLWSFMEWQNSPMPLMECVEQVNGRSELKAWRNGDTPSLLVNTSQEPIKVWTTLPPRSLFMHPGPKSDVMLAWTSPIDGDMTFSGRISDTHPTGPNGVTFSIEHWRTARTEASGSTDSISGSISDTIHAQWNEILMRTRELSAVMSERDQAAGPKPQAPLGFAVVDGQPKNGRIQLRGDPEKPGDEVDRQWISILGGSKLDNTASSGRRELAEWIVAHPLSTRVIVNRIWQYHFGQALVRTPNDFGARGERPTHPELLEWLSTEFVRQGRSFKSLHRIIMNSQAFRRASRGGERLAELDPDNRLLARFSRRRLSAEELRDSLLVIGGNLDTAAGEAHPFPPEKQWTYTQHTPFSAVYENSKRSIYQMVQRQRRHPFLALFDGADPNASTAMRQMTTAPTQALYFLNDPFFHEQTSRLAAELQKMEADEVRLRRLVAILFQRQPKSDELRSLHAFLESYPGDADTRWSALCRVLAASNEFVTVE